MSEIPQNRPRAKPTAAAAPQRPAAPTPANPPAAGDSGDSSVNRSMPPGLPVVEDDDSVIVPALSPEMLASHRSCAGASPRPLTRSLFFRQTMIPILLTMGVMLPLLAAMWFASDANHIARTTGLWLPVTFIALGAVFLLLAVINMAQVKHMMKEQN